MVKRQSFDFSRFICKPFDYDDAQNTMYACWTANNIMRWPNANTANTTAAVPVALLNGGVATAV
jgi:hypothetical protein